MQRDLALMRQMQNMTPEELALAVEAKEREVMECDGRSSRASSVAWQIDRRSADAALSCTTFADFRDSSPFGVQLVPLLLLLMLTVPRTLSEVHDGSKKWLLLPWAWRRCRWLAQHVHPASWHGCHSNYSLAVCVLAQ